VEQRTAHGFVLQLSSHLRQHNAAETQRSAQHQVS
jgi:hypothetical protein